MKKSEMKVLYEVKTLKNFMRIFEYHDHKFKIKIQHRNGTPLGFNYNCCLMIMAPDGTFKDVVDSRMLECGYMNRYVLDEGDYRLKEINDKAIKAFYDYVKAVY